MTDPNENRPGYKKTKVGWIPADWRVTAASTLSPFVTSGSRGWADYYADSGDLFMRITNLRRETPRPDLSDARYVNLPSSSAEGRRTLLQKDDLLISITADLGIICHVSANIPSPAYISQHLAILRFPSKVQHDRKFLAYSLMGERIGYHFYKVTDQGAKAGLNLNAIRQLPLILPPLSEQQKIAEILSTWDDAIEQTRALIEAKKKQKKALMQQLLTGKRRLPGFVGEWEWPKAHLVFDRRSERSAGEEPVLSVTQDEGIVVRSEFNKRIDYDENNTANYKIVEPDDFVISLRSFQGGLEISRIRGRVSPAYHVIKKVKPVSPRFYKHYFKSYDFIEHLDIAVIGIRDGKQVSYEDFSSLTIPCPTLEEQRAIAAVLDAADSEISSLDSKLEALQRQKKGLMQRLLTGQVRVKG